MKKIIFSAIALLVLVAFTSCREQAEETTDETTVIEETVETPVVEKTTEMAIESTSEVVDTTQAAVKEIQK